jgi:hypothetical protein
MFILIIHQGRWISTSNLTILKYIKKSVINIGTKVYNKLPGYIKEIDSYKAFKKELKSFLLLRTFYSVEEFVSL